MKPKQSFDARDGDVASPPSIPREEHVQRPP
jgi:hypothetical protein